MPYQQFSDGLYLKTNFAIKRCGSLVNNAHPVVIHQTPPFITLHWLQDTGAWDVLGKIEDETDAIKRMNKALENPRYDLFGHNCEHFARYVATGKRESTQLQAVGIVAGFAALVYVASR